MHAVFADRPGGTIMARIICGLLLATGFLAGFSVCRAQQPPPVPTPTAPPAAGPVILPPPPPPGAVPPAFDPAGDPAWEWQPPPPGWFGNFEVDLVGPHVKNRLTAAVPINGLPFASTVHLPTAELDWAGMPRFELGYRMKEDLGEWVAAFRFLYTEGDLAIPNYDFFGTGWLSSRLNLNVLDLDYRTCEHWLGAYDGPAPCWTLQGTLGLRLANVFFDSQTQSRFLEQRTSNLFIGMGPHAAVELVRRFGDTGLSAYGRLDGAVAIGRVSQSFEEVRRFRSNGPGLGGALDQSGSQASPSLTVQVGLSWQPPRYDFTRFTFGYHFEQWWYVGRLQESRADLTLQGLFFRGGFEF
jgi:hypothetical protein